MTDKTEIAALVERLEGRMDTIDDGNDGRGGMYLRHVPDADCREAAALLTSLAEERERMREALEFTDEQLDLLTRTAVAGFYSDDPTLVLNGPMWENLSTRQRGNWRRAVRAMVRTLEGNRHWLESPTTAKEPR